MDVIEWLDAQTVAGDEQLALAFIPNRKREHAAQVLNASRAVLFVEMQDRLRVRVRAIAMTARFEQRAIVCMIIDLAVIDDVQRLVLVRHRLMPARDINDAQAPMTETDGA